MAEQQPGWHQALPIPDSHQRIRASTGEPGAIGTPGHVIERDRVALQDVGTLPTLYLKCGKRATAFRHVGELPPAGGNIHLTLLIGYRRISA